MNANKARKKQINSQQAIVNCFDMAVKNQTSLKEARDTANKIIKALPADVPRYVESYLNGMIQGIYRHTKNTHCSLGYVLLGNFYSPDPQHPHYFLRDRSGRREMDQVRFNNLTEELYPQWYWDLSISQGTPKIAIVVKLHPNDSPER